MPCDFMMARIDFFLRIIFSIISLNYLGVKVLSCNKGMSVQTKDFVIKLNDDMHPSNHIEPNNIEESIRDSETT